MITLQKRSKEPARNVEMLSSGVEEECSSSGSGWLPSNDLCLLLLHDLGNSLSSSSNSNTSRGWGFYIDLAKQRVFVPVQVGVAAVEVMLSR